MWRLIYHRPGSQLLWSPFPRWDLELWSSLVGLGLQEASQNIQKVCTVELKRVGSVKITRHTNSCSQYVLKLVFCFYFRHRTYEYDWGTSLWHLRHVSSMSNVVSSGSFRGHVSQRHMQLRTLGTPPDTPSGPPLDTCQSEKDTLTSTKTCIQRKERRRCRFTYLVNPYIIQDKLTEQEGDEQRSCEGSWLKRAPYLIHY